MLRYRLTLMLMFCLLSNPFAQRQRAFWTGYIVYEDLIKASDFKSATSFVILDELEVENNSFGLVEAVKSGDTQMLYAIQQPLELS